MLIELSKDELEQVIGALYFQYGQYTKAMIDSPVVGTELARIRIKTIGNKLESYRGCYNCKAIGQCCGCHLTSQNKEQNT